MSTAQSSGTSALSDPLIGAMVGKLPMPGSPYPLSQRLNWLRMMVMAFNEAYGVDAPITVGELLEARKPLNIAPAEPIELVVAARAAVPSATARYRVDEQGFALFGETPIDPGDIPAGAILFDERGASERGDLESILWKTGGAVKASKLGHLRLQGAD